MKYVNQRGFILSLEPALSLLMLLLLVILIYQYLQIQYSSHGKLISKMYETDLWLVNDSIHYYDANDLYVKYEWLKKELTIS